VSVGLILITSAYYICNLVAYRSTNYTLLLLVSEEMFLFT